MQLSVMRTESRLIFNETDSSNSHFTDTQLTTWSNECYRFILTKLGVIPIKERDYTSAATITLNSRMATINEAYMQIQPQNEFTPLEIVDQEFLAHIDPNWLSAGTDVPRYFVRSDTFQARLFPAPNAANTGQTIRTYGLEFPSDMSSDTDTPTIPLNLHDLFPHFIAYRAFQQLGQVERSTAELIFVNSVLKSQQAISTQFSQSRNRWLWTESV